jgi:hypothetical protein
VAFPRIPDQVHVQTGLRENGRERRGALAIVRVAVSRKCRRSPGLLLARPSARQPGLVVGVPDHVFEFAFGGGKVVAVFGRRDGAADRDPKQHVARVSWQLGHAPITIGSTATGTCSLSGGEVAGRRARRSPDTAVRCQ